MQNVKKNIKIKIYALAVYQILGGISGVISIIPLITESKFGNVIILLYLIPFILYSFSIYSGILLFNNRKLKISYSFINQYLQLINFSILGYGFTYITGFYLSTGFDFTNSILLKFNFGLATWQINIGTDAEIIYLNLNLVALILIVFINNLKKRIKENKIQSQISMIGEV